jgi:hypothetical protein
MQRFYSTSKTRSIFVALSDVVEGEMSIMDDAADLIEWQAAKAMFNGWLAQ